MLKGSIIGFIGAGNMARALIKGLIQSKLVTAAQVAASDKDKEKLLELAEKFEVKVYSKNYEVAKASDIIILAIKPQDLDAALKDIAPDIKKSTVIISIIAGKRTDTILNLLLGYGLKRPVAVIRAMPNAATLVGEGAIGVFAPEGADKKALDIALAIFGAVGAAVKIDDESLLDVVTGLSGSGPAYVFLFMDALISAGVTAGLSKEDAKTLTLKTTLGAARMAMESSKTLDELISMVASPGGTTVEGLKALEKAGFKTIVEDAVKAAIKRAGELSA